MARRSSRTRSSSSRASRESQRPSHTLELVDIVRQRAHRWVNLPNVTSVGVGWEVDRRGEQSGELSIQVTVAEKIDDADEIGRRGWQRLPDHIVVDHRRIPVDVLQRSYGPAFVLVEPAAAEAPAAPLSPRLLRRRRLDPVRPGISISHIRGVAGTLGGIVFDRTTGAACVVSNFHVLQGADGNIRDRVVQPGPNDDGNVEANVVGHVVRSHVGLAGDCAIASITGRRFEPSILELDVVPRRMARVEIGDMVVKSGRTSGVTRGKIERVGVVVTHDYGGRVGKRQIGAFEIGPVSGANPGQLLSKEGDSGAIWMIEEGGTVTDIAAGLHFALDTSVVADADHALACPIHAALEKVGAAFTR